MDVFVVGAGEVAGSLRFLCDFVESAAISLRGFVALSVSGALKRPRKRLRALDIGEDQLLIEVQRSRKLFKDFRRSRFESAAPQLHSD